MKCKKCGEQINFGMSHFHNQILVDFWEVAHQDSPEILKEGYLIEKRVEEGETFEEFKDELKYWNKKFI